MLEVKWQPKEKEKEGKKVKKWAGTVGLKLLTRSQRLELLDACGVGIDKDEEIVFEKSMIKSLAIGTELAAKYVTSVDLKNVETEEEYKSYEELSYDPDADDVVMDLLISLWKGVKPGKKPKP